MNKNVFLSSVFVASAIVTTSAQTWNLTGNNNATATSILGTTNAVNLRLHTRNLPRLVIDSNGKVGIGISNPVNQFTVRSSGGTPASIWLPFGNPVFVGFGEGGIGSSDFNLMMASDTYNSSGTFIFKRSRGVLSAPTSVQNNDLVGSLSSFGYDGTAFRGAASVDFFVDGVPSTGNVPTRISFTTGSNSSKVERLKVGSTGNFNFNNTQLTLTQSNGRVGIGTSTPAAKLDVVGNIRIADGTQGTGRVLTSDANGVAKWASSGSLPTGGTAGQTLRYNGSAYVASSLLVNTGSAIGIGETAPAGILHVSQPGAFAGVTFTGTGLNDLSTNISGYTGSGSTSYAIRIQNAGPNPNMIEISNDGGATWSAPVAITNPITLANGVTASFASTNGHTFGDNWSWTVSQSFYNTLVVKNGRVGVGTSSPGARLDVNGDALINGLTAGLGAGNLNSNTAFGFSTLSRNTTGIYGTGSGNNALAYNTSGQYKTAYGAYSQYSVTKANYNTSVGTYALYYDSITGTNTAIGLSAGDYTYNPTQGTFLGASSYGGANLTNMTAVGYNAAVSASNSVRVGNYYVTSIGGQVGWSTFSDARFKKNIEENVPGLAFINKLRPVTYNLNVSGIESKLQEIVVKKPRNKGDQLPADPKPSAAEIKAKEDKAKIKYTGFLAQEVEAAAKSLNYDFSGVDAPKNDKDFYGLRYDEFIMPLVKSVQELSKQNDELKKTNADLEARLSKLEGIMNVNNPADSKQQNTSLTSATLDQNIPNPPINNATRISYNIPNGSLKAELNITDNYGKKVKQIILNNSGKGVLNVDTAGLAPGTYSYTLYVDGRLIETKSMVVTGK